MYIDDYVYDEFLENWLDVYVFLKCWNILCEMIFGGKYIKKSNIWCINIV